MVQMICWTKDYQHFILRAYQNFVISEQLLTQNQFTFTMNELYTNKLKFITCHGMNTKNLTRVT